jgi:lipid A ethanolaminephosphotransferase
LRQALQDLFDVKCAGDQSRLTATAALVLPAVHTNDTLDSTRPGLAVYDWLRSRVQQPFKCRSDVRFALGASLLWAVAYNLRFWHQTFDAMWQPSFSAVLFLASLFVLVTSVQAILVLLVPTRWLMRAAASLLFTVAALGSYFTSAYGAIMNKDMLRNVVQTDPAEVGGLLTFDLVAHVVLLGLLPAALVWRIALPEMSWRSQLRRRAVFIASALALSVAGMFACSANYAVFFRQHKPIRFSLSPAAPIVSLAGLFSSSHAGQSSQPLIDPAGKVQRVAAPHPRPLVVFVVLGETARAANFQLGGYQRATNPRLQNLGEVVYFPHVTSCDTSTATSVPCMFSHLTRTKFDVDEAGHYTNLLDSLTAAQLDVEWRENNAGCKGVCARVRTISYGDRPDQQLCSHSYCYDEVMLTDLRSRLETVQQDTVMVFHQIGSHGPAYSQRYPASFEIFKPACSSAKLQDCSAQEIVNAYDNTIAYTDYVLARQIELLKAAAGAVDSLLIYASDHGESLGEQGLYLHGMPYAFAPRTQKEVPMLMWMSPGYAQRFNLDAQCVRSHAGEPLSHDNLYHTVLGATGVRNQLYDPALDVLSACRRKADRE